VIFANDESLQSVKLKAKAVGELTITKLDNGFIQMDFPNTKPEPVDEVPVALMQGLSAEPLKVLRNQQAYFAVYNNEADILNMTYDAELIKSLAPYDLVVTAPSTKYDFVSRYFWPANGGDEDPVTGSIHTGLAPYWAEIFGKKKLNAYQASARGGILLCEIVGDRVTLSGQAVPYLSGEITIKT
jgi:predicted PhzF superfamily epimerase YddE/YHI9